MFDEQVPQEQPGSKKWMDSAGFYRHIVGTICDLLCVLDHAGRIVESSCRSERLAVPGSSQILFDAIHPDQRMAAHNAYLKVLAHHTIERLQYQMQSKDGGWVWVETVGIPFQTPEEPNRDYVILATRDITEQKDEESSLKRLAFHDPLTGLPNRRLFHEHLNQAIAQAKRRGGILAVFYMDIDDFKQINDRMGHEAGDLFLKAFAQRVKGCVREIDTFARMGGDEFTVLLPTVDTVENVEKVARRLMNALTQEWEVEEHRFSATISIGIAVYPAAGTDSETLLRHVDQALYEVKSRGRNGYQFYGR